MAREILEETIAATQYKKGTVLIPPIIPLLIATLLIIFWTQIVIFNYHSLPEDPIVSRGVNLCRNSLCAIPSHPLVYDE